MQSRDPSTAPLPLRWVEDLINTRSLVYGTDDLATPADLATWLHARDLLPADPSVQPADLSLAIRLREGLRALLASKETPGVDVADLGDLANDLPLVIQVVAGRAPRLAPRDLTPIDAALARLLSIAAESATTGMWDRLKVCHNTGCWWAYYDHSRNKSRTWCSMETCGNQAKARAFRRRH